MSHFSIKGRKKSLEKIPFDRVEDFRKTFSYKVYEMATLLGFTTRQYNRCKNQGRVPAFRYYALKNAMMIHVLQESQSQLEVLSRM